MHWEVVSNNGLGDLDSSTLEIYKGLFDHSILVRSCFITRSRKNGNKPLSFAIFALGREVGSPMLFFKFYLFCLGDSHIFWEAVIARGALDLQKPDVFLMDLDGLHVFSSCREDDAEIRHEIRYINYYHQSILLIASKRRSKS